MSTESDLIIKRRFVNRFLESGLLIIAVALGVGAAASGLSLFFHTNEYAASLLKSPEYKEVVVTTKSNIDDMNSPVMEKAIQENTVLTTYDLKAGELVPDVTFSYITKDSHIWLMNENTVNQKFGPGRAPGTKIENNESNEFLDRFNKAKENTDLVIAEIEEMFGLEVTSQFFNAQNLIASEGSLLTRKDFTSTENYIVLGSELANTLTPNGIDSLIGKKLVSWFNIYTVIGILNPTESSLDNQFFIPKKELSENENFRRRKGGDNSQLRFYVSDVEKLESTVIQLENWFKSQYGESQIAVSNPRTEAIKVLNRNRGISTLILFLSLAGLFIASVNVSNILMSRSIRMKKHVGILKALGASKVNILKLFIKEAIVITSTGSLLGTGLAIPLSIGMEKSLGLGTISWLYVFIGVTLSSLLTLIFSVLPARQNSNINASDAMRSGN